MLKAGMDKYIISIRTEMTEQSQSCECRYWVKRKPTESVVRTFRRLEYYWEAINSYL